jgi:hypothetical protein
VSLFEGKDCVETNVPRFLVKLFYEKKGISFAKTIKIKEEKSQGDFPLLY